MNIGSLLLSMVKRCKYLWVIKYKAKFLIDFAEKANKVITKREAKLASTPKFEARECQIPFRHNAIRVGSSV